MRCVKSNITGELLYLVGDEDVAPYLFGEDPTSNLMRTLLKAKSVQESDLNKEEKTVATEGFRQELSQLVILLNSDPLVKTIKELEQANVLLKGYPEQQLLLPFESVTPQDIREAYARKDIQYLLSVAQSV